MRVAGRGEDRVEHGRRRHRDVGPATVPATPATGYNSRVTAAPHRGRAGRFRRRSASWPAVVALAVAAIALAPVVVPAAVLVDLLRRRSSLPALRLWAFLVQFLLLELATLAAGAALWLAFGAGRRLGLTTWLGRRPADAPPAGNLTVPVSLPA